MTTINLQTVKTAIMALGRSLPLGMELFFYREEDDSRVRMQMVEPDGKNTEYAFVKKDAFNVRMLCWIGVDATLPDADRTVLVNISGESSEPVWAGYHDGEQWLDVSGMPITVTHWCDFPEPVEVTK